MIILSLYKSMPLMRANHIDSTLLHIAQLLAWAYHHREQPQAVPFMYADPVSPWLYITSRVTSHTDRPHIADTDNTQMENKISKIKVLPSFHH